MLVFVIDTIPCGTGLETDHVLLLRAVQLREPHACCDECAEFHTVLAVFLLERDEVRTVF